MTTMVLRAVLALCLSGIAIPLGAQQPVPGLVANPTLKTTALTLVTGGRKHKYTVELARTTTEQARGLMLRKAMPRDHGMIFPVSPPRTASFWMEGTILPLDIIFIGTDRKVLRIAANAVPFSRAPIDSDGLVSAVLELNAGEAARIGLRPGDAVDYAL